MFIQFYLVNLIYFCVCLRRIWMYFLTLPVLFFSNSNSFEKRISALTETFFRQLERNKVYNRLQTPKIPNWKIIQFFLGGGENDFWNRLRTQLNASSEIPKQLWHVLGSPSLAALVRVGCAFVLPMAVNVIKWWRIKIVVYARAFHQMLTHIKDIKSLFRQETVKVSIV